MVPNLARLLRPTLARAQQNGTTNKGFHMINDVTLIIFTSILAAGCFIIYFIDEYKNG